MNHLNTSYRLYLTLVFCSLATACTSVRLITDYDEVTDHMVTELQAKTARHFAVLDRTIGTDTATYEFFIPFYDDVKVGLSSLEVRSQALKNNSIVIQQVKLLRQMTKDLEALHRLGIRSKEELKPLESAFNSAYASIIKLQLALKRGEE